MSLLLRRPLGREAYPGDVFYLHSRRKLEKVDSSTKGLERINLWYTSCFTKSIAGLLRL